MGIFVTVEGPNGVGKTTFIQNLTERLKNNNFNILVTKEPSESEFGKIVRKNENNVRGIDYAKLIAIDRAWHVNNVITPALRENHIVICDRYIDSSLVLQVFDGVSYDSVWELNSKFPKPDVDFVLLASDDIILRRLKEREKLTYYEKIMERNEEIIYYLKAIEYLEKKKFNILKMYNNNNDDLSKNLALAEETIINLYNNLQV